MSRPIPLVSGSDNEVIVDAINTTESYRLNSVEGILPERGQALFRSMLRSRDMYAGEVLFWRGDRSGSVFFVVEGELSLWREEPGGQQELLRFAEEGDIVTPGALLDDGVRSRCCLAERDTKVMELTPMAFRMLTALKPNTAASALVALGLIANGHPDSGDPGKQEIWIDQQCSAI